jgi:gliding motility-associated-like protein
LSVFASPATFFKSVFISRNILFFVLCWVFCLTGFSQGPAYTVPVVFHIVGNNPSSVTDQQIQDAVLDLNNAFAHSGNYSTGNGAHTGIHFCLARVAPDGGISAGITRTQSVLGDLDGDLELDRLKKLVSWDTRAYCNIWIVDSIRNEFFTSFSCGAWSRRHGKSYASFSTDGDEEDGIVTNEFGSNLAMLMGNYLGLPFAFTYGSCTNNNCNSDGDGVCDTPPASIPGSSCTSVQNSCSSDTLSGFTKDMSDLTANFMSFSGPCTNSFTEGQAAKMRSVCSGVRSSLFSQSKCDPPCSENINAAFTRNNWLPKTGDLIQFTSSSTGGSNYQWLVNDGQVGGNSPVYSQSFNQAGKYKVSLKVFNASQTCFGSYTDSVTVGCGVMARFYPDKRIIASKDQILNDSIFFTNRSVNGASYQWWISNDSGMGPKIISTSYHLNQLFSAPGHYSVWLVALNGGCSDTTEKFNFTVYDPAVDATISLQDVQCYEETRIKISFAVCNQGYASMPALVPVAFYDGDPRTDTAKKIDSVYLLPTGISGNCCAQYNTIVNVGRSGLNRIYAVVNDKGNQIPIQLPGSSLTEKNYQNNVSVAADFQFKATITPPAATLEPGDHLQLEAHGNPGTAAVYLWSDASGLNCTDCAGPVFIADKKDVSKKLIVTSSYGCIDSAFVIIKVPVIDDYTIRIDSMVCADSGRVFAAFSVCNLFDRGFIPNGLKVSLYAGNPASDTAHLMKTTYTLKTNNLDNCISFNDFFEGPVSETYYAVVNDSALAAPVYLPGDSTFLEKDYTNNGAVYQFTPFTVNVSPADTTVVRGSAMTFHVEAAGGSPSFFNWVPSEYLSCSDCADPTATARASQHFEVDVQNQYACKAKGYAQINTISGGRVSIPNAFSPNGDGRNDVFYIMGNQEIKVIKSFSIFNRWGMTVFSKNNIPPNDPGFGWNGLDNGRPSTAESYVYVVVIEFKDGTQQVYRGSIVLIL